MAKHIHLVFRIVAIMGISLLAISRIHYKFTVQNRTDEATYFAYKFDIINKIRLQMYSMYDMTDIALKSNVLRQKSDIDLIVIHHDTYPNEDNSWAKTDNYHRENKGWQSIQYHYFISRSGNIYFNHYPTEITIHAGTDAYNARSLGVCVQGNFNKDTLQGLQLVSTIKLLYKLKKDYPNAEIKGHRDLKATECPGKNVNINLLTFWATFPNIKYLKQWKP